jgi:hypothetical protein
VVTSIEPKKITFFKPTEGIIPTFYTSFDLIKRGMLEGDLDSPNPMVKRIKKSQNEKCVVAFTID